MYEAFFGLKERPFAPAPRLDQYFPATAIEGARQTLMRCTQRAEGAGMVVGPSGTGKTLLCHVLAEHFRGLFKTVLLASGRLGTRRALLQAILHGLGQPYRGMDEGECRLALVDYLTLPKSCPGGMVLVIDEAHTLPLRLLDELRMLTNLVSGGQPRIRLLLAGGMVLEERFASPKLESFSQRLAARCYLEAFNRCETEDYIHAQIKKMGGNGEDMVPPDACHAVYQATDGVPRLVNQLCDHALILAYVAGKRVVEPALVEEAWSDLQQLPSPWSGAKKDQPCGGGVIEFGGLDDEPEAAEPEASAKATPKAVGKAKTDKAVATEEPPVRTLPIPSSRKPDPAPVQQLEQIEQMIAGLNDDFQPAGSIRPEVELIFDDPSNPFGESFQEEEVVLDRYLAAIQRRRKAEAEQARQDAPAETTGPGPRETVPLRRLPLREAFASDDIIIEDEIAEEPEASKPAGIAPVRNHEFRQLFARLRSSQRAS